MESTFDGTYDIDSEIQCVTRMWLFELIIRRCKLVRSKLWFVQNWLLAVSTRKSFVSNIWLPLHVFSQQVTLCLQGALWLTCLTLIPACKVISSIITRRMKLIPFHSQTSMVQSLRFWNRYVIPHHTLLPMCIWWGYTLSMLVKGAPVSFKSYIIWIHKMPFNRNILNVCYIWMFWTSN